MSKTMYVVYGNKGVQPWRTDAYLGLSLKGGALYAFSEDGEGLVGLLDRSSFLVDGSRYGQTALLPHFANRDYVHAYLGEQQHTSLRGFDFRWRGSVCRMVDLDHESTVAELQGSLWRPFTGPDRDPVAEVLVLPQAKELEVVLAASPRGRMSVLAERAEATFPA